MAKPVTEEIRKLNLEKLRSTFEVYRQNHPSPKRHYTDELRQMVVEAKGLATLPEISNLIAVSKTTISKWVSETKSNPKQLRVVQVRREDEGSGALAEIRIGSRIQICVPVCSLSAPLIGALMTAEVSS